MTLRWGSVGNSFTAVSKIPISFEVCTVCGFKGGLFYEAHVPRESSSWDGWRAPQLPASPYVLQSLDIGFPLLSFVTIL